MSSFYEKNHQECFRSTVVIDPTSFLEPLASRLRPGATVLDVGCGSARDLLWFREYGFKPTGFEGSPALARLAEDHSGCPVIVGDFSSYDFSVHSFDALVFVGSLVHLHELQFPEVLARVSRAVKDTGKMYLTLKEGEGMAKDPMDVWIPCGRLKPWRGFFVTGDLLSWILLAILRYWEQVSSLPLVV